MMELLVAVIFSTPVPIYLCGSGGSHKREGSLLTREPWRNEKMALTSPACLSPPELFLPSPRKVGNGLAGEAGLTPCFLQKPWAAWNCKGPSQGLHPQAVVEPCLMKLSTGCCRHELRGHHDVLLTKQCSRSAPAVLSALWQAQLLCCGESQAN